MVLFMIYVVILVVFIVNHCLYCDAVTSLWINIDYIKNEFRTLGCGSRCNQATERYFDGIHKT